MAVHELCVPCANRYSEAFTVKKVSGGADNKITCEHCKKRRYGGTYEVTRKKKEAKK